jgi:hypothetical protein
VLGSAEEHCAAAGEPGVCKPFDGAPDLVGRAGYGGESESDFGGELGTGKCGPSAAGRGNRLHDHPTGGPRGAWLLGLNAASRTGDRLPEPIAGPSQLGCLVSPSCV